jgi:hypothetical protein
MIPARYDFVEAVGKGYSFVFQNIRLIAPLAGIPVLVKLGCLSLIIALELSGNFLRQGLLLLPSYFLEGWLIAYLVRVAIYDERGMESLSGKKSEDEIFLRERARNILAATIVYVLIKLALSFTTGSLLGYQRQIFGDDPQAVLQSMPEPSGQTMVVAFAILGAFIYSFRYLWMNVAVALGYGVRDFVLAQRGGFISLLVIGTWLMCFVPFALAIALGSEMLINIIPGENPQDGAIYQFLMTGLQAIIDTAISLVTAVAMAYGICEIMSGGKSKK